MAYKHVIRAKTRNLMTDEMFISAGFTKQPDGSWYVPDSTVLNKNKLLWENTEGIAGPITMSFYGRSSAQYYAGVAQWLVEDVDGTITYRTPTGTSSEWVYGTWTFDNKTVSKVYWVNITGRPLYLRDVMFEWGSTPTPYTPYNYLQSNKRMIKVSDVCQLYAKNIWKEYTDLYGVSIKNNNDGSITLNGTATESFYYTNILDYEIKPNHVYFYFDAYNEESSWSTYVGGCEGKLIDASGASGANYAIYNMKREGTIEKARPDLPKNLLNTFCRCYKGFTLNNVTIKPQLFDLTEMFGAGHEPATVAEFRQRFPNEYYPYSPQCWLTSYKSAVVCKTKNLFDVNNAVVINYNTQQETTDATHYVKDGIVYTDWNNYNIGTCVGIKGNWTLPAGTYTMSAKIAYNTKRNDKDEYRGGNIGFACVLADGSITRYMQWRNCIIPGERYTYTAEIPEGCKNIMLYLGASADPDIYSLPAAYCELMIEQGSTATSYVPYQHL